MDTNIGEEYRQIDRFIEVQQDETNKRHGLRGAYRDRAHAKIVRLRKWALKFPYVTPPPHEGRDAEIIRLMVHLHKIKDIPSKQLRTGPDISITRITNWLRLISGGLLLVILAAVGVFLLHVVDPAYPRIVALAADLMLTLLVLLSMILDTAIPLLCIVFALEYDFQVRQFELAHDLRMAEELHEFDLNTLKAGEQWLGMKLERFKFRMLVMFGGSDKLAMFALVGLAWAIRKLLQSDAGLLSEQWVTVVFAGLLGATLGGLLANVVVKRLLYTKDIVALAIRKREEAAEGDAKS